MEQTGSNKVATFFGGVRDGEIKIVNKDTVEIKVVECPDFPSEVTEGVEYEEQPGREYTYREEPPGSGNFHLKGERVVKD
jgi:hypothetical protein